MKKLKAIPNSHFFSKEAGSIRGISDILGCVNGTFVAIEVKRSLEESKKYSPRNALQDKYLKDIQKVGGKAYKVFPENEEDVLNDLYKI
jgi:IS30 family transposase